MIYITIKFRANILNFYILIDIENFGLKIIYL